MGTNYYAVRKGRKFTDGRVKKTHIGKSSGGWKFLFEWTEEFPKDFEKMKSLLRDYYDIYDEYERYVELNDFIEWVETKQKDKRNRTHIGLDDSFVLDKNGYEFTKGSFS